MNHCVIHISGASGSGKSTLGVRLKNRLKNAVVVKDLDDLRDEFIQQFYGHKKWTHINEREYQQYIHDFVQKQRKPLIFVGLNDNRVYGKNKNLFYDVFSDYHYFIDADDAAITKQKCLRLLNDIQTDNRAMQDLTSHNDRFVSLFRDAVQRECSLAETRKQNNVLKRHYAEQNYKFMTQENIFRSVVKIISTRNKKNT